MGAAATISAHGVGSAQELIDAIASHVAVLDSTGKIIAVNAAWRQFAESNAALGVADPHDRTGIGSSYVGVCRQAVGASSDEASEVAAGVEAVLRGERPRFELDYPCPAPGVPRWFRLRVTSLSGGGALVEHLDVTERAMSTAMVVAQGHILEAIATGRPLEEVFEQIVDLVESQLPAALCSILRVEPGSGKLRFAAGRHLPAVYNEAVDGVPIGPRAGSCGTAAYRKAPVDVADIATDPLWDDYRHLALPHGLRACLSFPVLASGDVAGVPQGEVLATFAIYQHVARSVAAPMTTGLPGSFGLVGGAAAHLVGVALERDHAYAALRGSEARLRAILDHSPALIFLKEVSGRYVLVNRHLVELTRVPMEAWPGRTTAELLGPAAGELFEAGHRSVIATREVDQREEHVTLPGGRQLTLLSVQWPLFDREGALSGVWGISTDITGRVRAEAERDQLWSHSPDPVCIADLETAVIEVNAEWTRRFGWTNDELRGRRVAELVHPDDVPGTTEAFAALRKGEPLRGFEHQFRCRDGQYRWLSWNALPLVELGRLYGFVRDVTDERRLQEQLRQTQKLEAIGQLAGGVAHDFNNLLTIIQGNVNALGPALGAEDPNRELLQEIEEASERASALTRQLLAFSRKSIVEPRTVDLDRAVETASRMLRRLIGEDIDLELALGSGASVRIDPGHLEQVLMNLVLNARDAMPRGGPLRIATSAIVRDEAAPPTSTGALAPGRYAVLAVADRGVGIDPALIDRVFEPFFTTKGVGAGTGLGLATVYGIVRQAEGQISVGSELGRGTEFKVFLPAVPAIARERPATGPVVPANGHETILLAEDEPALRRLASRVLTDRGYRVLTATDGEDALRVSTAHEGSIDLLVTDVIMPGLGGRELVEAIRRQRPGLRILYLSGYTDDAVLRHGIEWSREPFLLKPFTPSILSQKVREILDEPAR